jgi:hypothetical protein
MSRPSVIDEVFNRLAFGQDIALAQFPDAGGGFRRGVFLSRALALGPPLFPQSKRFLHELVGAVASAGGKRGKMGFCVGRQANFHAPNVALPAARFKGAIF